MFLVFVIILESSPRAEVPAPARPSAEVRTIPAEKKAPDKAIRDESDYERWQRNEREMWEEIWARYPTAEDQKRAWDGADKRKR